MNLINEITEIATEEWEFFNRQELDLNGNYIRKGKTETDEGYWQRVGKYWNYGVNNKVLNGKDTDNAWSAAFISYVMKKQVYRIAFCIQIRIVII